MYKNIMEAQVCDGYGYTLQITYKDGRKRVIEGDIGGGTIDGIMGNYLKKIHNFVVIMQRQNGYILEERR